jgi:CheY-like chemotaxis protein
LQPAAALVDIGLPEMTGYELARALRRRVPGIQLVAITGYGQGADRERALAIGFAEHLVKPALIDDVVATLERLLGNAP